MPNPRLLPKNCKEIIQRNYGILVLFGALILVNATLWGVSIGVYLTHSPSSIPYLVVAYTLGLRHALDADHIAAIDNATRRFMLDDRTPLTIGLLFSLGHSTIVVIGTLVVAVVANTFYIDEYGHVGSLIGTLFSASFLMLIGIVNCFAAYSLAQRLKILRLSDSLDECVDIHKHAHAHPGGFFTRFFGEKLFKFVDRPWKMYIIGLLFGLGFDTATEIALLSIVVIRASDTSPWIVILLSFIFACGMALVDSIDAVLMFKIYGWDAVSPVHKLSFSIYITILSVVFAIGTSVLQILGVIQSQYEMDGPVWEFVSFAVDRFDFIGVFIIVCFIASFAITYAIMKMDKKPLSKGKPVVVEILPITERG